MDTFSKHKVIWKYFLTGGLAGSVDVLMLFVFKEYFGFWYLTSAILAFLVSFGLAFLAHKYWTFNDYSDNDIHGQFVGYLLTVLFTLLLNLLVLSFLVELTGMHYISAQIISLFAAGAVGFVINVRNVFNRPCNGDGVLIASGIFPPEIGGPASHISKLARELTSRGIKLTVVTYAPRGVDSTGDGFEVVRVPSDLPMVLRGLAYFVELFVSAVNYPTIFAQDVTSTGLPAMIVKKILPKKKFVLRIGGDILWEREAEAGNTKLSMIDYYRSGAHRKKYLFKMGRMVISSADAVVVPAEFLKNIYVECYGIDSIKISVVKNPVVFLTNSLNSENDSGETRIIYAGRFLKLKNLEALLGAFFSIYDKIAPARLILIGDGPEKENLIRQLTERVSIIDTLPQSSLFDRIRGSNLCVCPSWTDVNSNFILECLALGKPVLSTRNNGLSIKLPEEMLFSYDDEEELQKKMLNILKDSSLAAQSVQLARGELSLNSWEGAVSRYLEIFSAKGGSTTR